MNVPYPNPRNRRSGPASRENPGALLGRWPLLTALVLSACRGGDWGMPPPTTILRTVPLG